MSRDKKIIAPAHLVSQVSGDLFKVTLLGSVKKEWEPALGSQVLASSGKSGLVFEKKTENYEAKFLVMHLSVTQNYANNNEHPFMIEATVN